ncbi:MAG: hypothetical protein ACW99Q_06465 [Candidatus Kariarchaeaceae archaeon]|jgi:hypothetical protein
MKNKKFNFDIEEELTERFELRMTPSQKATLEERGKNGRKGAFLREAFDEKINGDPTILPAIGIMIEALQLSTVDPVFFRVVKKS